MTGGFNFPGYENIATTETLTINNGADTWVEVGSLPVPMRVLKGVSFNNKIIMTGMENFILDHDQYHILNIYFFLFTQGDLVVVVVVVVLVIMKTGC